jgi:hypothetical protein
MLPERGIFVLSMTNFLFWGLARKQKKGSYSMRSIILLRLFVGINGVNYTLSTDKIAIFL